MPNSSPIVVILALPQSGVKTLLQSPVNSVYCFGFECWAYLGISAWELCVEVAVKKSNSVSCAPRARAHPCLQRKRLVLLERLAFLVFEGFTLGDALFGKHLAVRTERTRLLIEICSEASLQGDWVN